nr:MAG TPA: hypothetical protein [Caudoviricetes sp.]
MIYFGEAVMLPQFYNIKYLQIEKVQFSTRISV